MTSRREKKVDVERTVLGELTLAKPAEVRRVLALGLEPGMFTHAGHRIVYRAIKRLHDDGTPPDIVTVRNSLEANLESFGGDDFLIDVLNSSVNSAHVEHHAGILLDLNEREELDEDLQRIGQQIEDLSRPVTEIRAELRTTFEKTSIAPQQLPAFVTAGVPFDEFCNGAAKPAYLIDRVLSQGEEMIIGAPEKTLKTSMMADMAVSLGTGTPFLGYEKFYVDTPCRVLFMTLETGQAALQSLCHRVVRGRQLHPSDVGKMVVINQELPVITNDWHMRELIKYVDGEGFQVVFIDPAYLTLFGEGSKVQAGNVLEMGPLLRRITQVRKETDATIAMAHHTRKNQGPLDFFKFRKTTRDDLSQSGFAQWMRQWMLVSRKAAYSHDGKHVIHLEFGGSSGHSGEYVLQVDEGKKVVEEIRTDGQFASNERLTDWQTIVTPAREFDDAVKAEKQEHNASKKDATLELHVGKVRNAMKAEEPGKQLSKTAIATSCNLNDSNAGKALYELRRRGEVTLNDSSPTRVKWSLKAEPDKPDT